MSYLPDHFTVKNWDTIKLFIECFPLATIISVHEGEIFTSHIPLIFENDTLIGHINKNNPQFQHLDSSKVELIFNAGDAYISPSAFETDELPTFNYAKVHIKGQVQFTPETQMISSLVAMNTQMDNSYKLSARHPRIPILKEFIQGFEVSIDSFHGRFKMSQDKSKAHFEKAKSLLEESQNKRLNLFLKSLRY